MCAETLYDGGEDEPDEDPGSKSGSCNSGSVLEGRFSISPLTLSVFKRRTESGNVFRNFELQRTYPKGSDAGDGFGYTSGLRSRDLRKAARLLELAADRVEGFESECLEGDSD